jgi:hypothetical protein
MLAFDIETTGLDRERCEVTVVCTEDFHTGERRAYEFGRVAAGEACGPERQKLTLELVKAFDAAQSLCAFNGVRFDVPFLYKALRLSEATVAGWLVKTTDILEACRLEVFGPRHTFGLNLLCEHNGVRMKSGSGCEAVRMAAQGRWQELLDYCADDVRILCDLYRRKELKNPRGWRPIDLRRIAHSNLYAEQCSAVAEQCSAVVGDPKLDGQQLEVEALRAECAQLREQLQEVGAARDDLLKFKKKAEAQLELYKSICTCLDNFE